MPRKMDIKVLYYKILQTISKQRGTMNFKEGSMAWGGGGVSPT